LFYEPLEIYFVSYLSYIYSYTARRLLEFLSVDSHIGLDCKIRKARRMFYYIQ